MRSTARLVLLAALLAGGCDRRSPTDGQATPAASDIATTPTSDEAQPTGAAGTPVKPIGGDVDRSHRGTATPAYVFNDAAGKPHTLAEFKGRPVLVNLWATWCNPCVKELPTLNALAAGEAGTLKVVAISQDMEPAKVPAFLKQHPVPAIAVFTDPRMQWTLSVTANLPTTILYDAAGKEVWRTQGDLDWSGAFAKKALAEAGGATAG